MRSHARVTPPRQDRFIDLPYLGRNSALRDRERRPRAYSKIFSRSARTTKASLWSSTGGRTGRGTRAARASRSTRRRVGGAFTMQFGRQHPGGGLTRNGNAAPSAPPPPPPNIAAPERPTVRSSRPRPSLPARPRAYAASGIQKNDSGENGE